MEDKIDFELYINILKKNALMIAIVTSIAIIISGLISFFLLSPVYQTNTTLIVNKMKLSSEDLEIPINVTGDDINVAQRLALTYGEIIKSRKVLSEVIANLELDEPYESLAKKISVVPIKDTQIIRIIVEDTNPKKAADIANGIPDVFKKEAERTIQSISVEVLDEAVTPAKPVKPNKLSIITMSAILGLMISIITIFIKEYKDKKIKSPKEAQKYLGLPILGVVPKNKMN